MNKHTLISLLIFTHFIFVLPVLANTTESGSGELWLEEVTTDASVTANTSSALLLNTDVDVSITAMTASVTVSQTFQNTSSTWVNARYLFPLSDKASVNAMEMTIGDRTIRGLIKEKEEAKQVYEAAKKQGKQAALLQTSRPNMFSINAANIAPGSVITTRLKYLQDVTYKEGQFSLNIPTTFTPRYNPGKPLFNSDINQSAQKLGWAKPTVQVPDANKITPPQVYANNTLKDHFIKIKIELNSGFQLQSIDSSLHTLQWHEDNGVYQITLKDNNVLMDRDFGLVWKAVPHGLPQAAVFREDYDGDAYTTLMVIPPEVSSNQTIPREVIFIIDSSGSMGGIAMRQARNSLMNALDKLDPQDYFNIIEFDNNTHTLFNASAAATDDNIHSASIFIADLVADGGTEMVPALLAAFGQPTINEYLRQIVFITDGSVGNESELFKVISDNLGDARLFTVSIGSAPNHFFMRKAAQFGRGTVTSINNQSEVEEKINILFTHLQNPVLRDIKIHWPDQNTTISTKTSVEQFPQRIPDLYSGEPLIVHAKSSLLDGQISITGLLNNQQWSSQLIFPDASNSRGQSTIWASHKINHLMDTMITGSKESDVKPKVLSLALNHKLLSRYTSFVAVEDVIVKPSSESADDSQLSNLMPKGSTMSIPYPGTATSATLSFYLALILLLAALLLYRAGSINNHE